ncbi:MAG: hypothetical protein ABI605_13150 [Rhizobacter sp.]
MKIAPHFVVGLTSAAALSAGAILAVEDRALFDPQQTMLVMLAEDVNPSTRSVDAPREGVSTRRAASVINRSKH